MTTSTVQRPGLGGDSNTPALIEALGLNVLLVVGSVAGAKIDIPRIRAGDTIVSAINNKSGDMTDITGTITIDQLKATGTITVDGAVGGESFEVNGMGYTISEKGVHAYCDVQVGANDAETATGIVNAINGYEDSFEGGGNAVKASSDGHVVTVMAGAEGEGGDSITISSDDDGLVASGATLTGGSSVGGISSSVETNQLLVHWFKKAL